MTSMAIFRGGRLDLLFVDTNKEKGLIMRKLFYTRTIRMLVALAAHHRWPLYHMDAITTFWNGEFKEDVYITQPQGFSEQGSDSLNTLFVNSRRHCMDSNELQRPGITKSILISKKKGFVKVKVTAISMLSRTKANVVLLVLYVADLLFERSQVD